ncbi:hypothetical protein C5F47_05835 [Nitrosopumilus cobalaminigenes]|uniref:Uncharacterized protein n=1 Tax=Nitrosopumilus cobalaminigenes TaxID=1470066 RepID=A0A7D5R6Z1_9ARCH|nr:hypothetical protein C5F47_05835 [Nitrosopumilus cobalaminigenes]
MIFQKTNLKYLFLILFGFSILVGISIFTNNSCSVDHILISNDINSYEKSLDPEYCENILERIDLYNDQCQSKIEILDCG